MRYFLLIMSIVSLLITNISFASKTKALTNTTTLSTQQKQALIHLLKQDCGSCHGMTLKGGLGPSLLPEDLKNKPTALLENTILYGRKGTAMPPWENLLSKQEVKWLTQQIQQGVSDEIH